MLDVLYKVFLKCAMDNPVIVRRRDNPCGCLKAVKNTKILRSRRTKK
jgi:hypothetical protein